MTTVGRDPQHHKRAIHAKMAYLEKIIPQIAIGLSWYPDWLTAHPLPDFIRIARI
ncbi:MAG: hypothetical protein HN416_18065 [Nitrospina sp.]|jgi:hypothetical protein|nr:hypothetical protein [Nitrospina sp.]